MTEFPAFRLVGFECAAAALDAQHGGRAAEDPGGRAGALGQEQHRELPLRADVGAVGGHLSPDRGLQVKRRATGSFGVASKRHLSVLCHLMWGFTHFAERPSAESWRRKERSTTRRRPCRCELPVPGDLKLASATE
eukprot:scaffold803_cov310-Pinguiococcus_pyrenoidosus.AAC.9